MGTSLVLISSYGTDTPGILQLLILNWTVCIHGQRTHPQRGGEGQFALGPQVREPIAGLLT